MDSTNIGPSAAESLHTLLATNHDIADFINELAALAAAQVVGKADALCGILLSRDKRTTVVGHSNQQAKEMDEIQAGFDEGPCLEAQRTHTVVRVTDVQHERRWPNYMATARESGLRSIMAIPLSLEDKATAAMNFYTSEVDAFGEDDVVQARQFAKLTSLAVTVALRLAISAEAADDRRKAMESRTAIDIAVGIIMGQQQCDQDEAFRILAEVSSQRNVKVRDLARDLVASIGNSQPTTVFED